MERPLTRLVLAVAMAVALVLPGVLAPSGDLGVSVGLTLEGDDRLVAQVQQFADRSGLLGRHRMGAQME